MGLATGLFQDGKRGENGEEEVKTPREWPGTCAQPHTLGRGAPRLASGHLTWVQCYGKNVSHRGKCNPFLPALPSAQEDGDGGEREAFRTKGSGTPGNRHAQLPFPLAFLLTQFTCIGLVKDTDIEHKIRVNKQWQRAPGHLKSGRILSADLRQLWIRYLRLLCTESLWQGSGTMISPVFDEMTLCDYCTLKQFLYPLFLSLGFFSEDIFIVYQMRKKKNK